jgi:hypothetical protein
MTNEYEGSREMGKRADIFKSADAIEIANE